MSNTENYKQQFIDLYNAYIKREGADLLLEYLHKTDFFNAPASTKYHLCKEGGLCQHSVNVFNRLTKLLKFEYGDECNKDFSLESVAICALLHDICKTDYYTVDYRNVKEKDVWVKKPYYAVEDKLPYGHGEKSVYMLSAFIKLTREEAMAINWHMGGYDLRAKAGYPLSDVFGKYKLAFLLHTADNMATFLDEAE